jgi:lipoprotein-anchoring transpeptidase ErfK/SrfK
LYLQKGDVAGNMMKLIMILLLLSFADLCGIMQGGVWQNSSAVTPTPEGITPGERWIEVDIQAQVVRLHDGSRIVGEYMASTGVDTTPQTTTYPGLFTVQQKIEGPFENVPGVYVKDAIIFDWAHGNGIHSVPMDENGTILDDRLGQPVTAGCVRVEHSGEVFDFARLGMKV